MQYISEQEFLKQPEKVQKAFLDWWQPEFGDLFLEDYWDEDSDINVVGCVPISKEHFEDYKGKTHYKTDLIIPLFTEGQLREFIEDKTGKTLSIMKSLEGKNEYLITLHHLGLEGDPLSLYREYDNLGNDVLQAYWKVACMITKEEFHDR